MNEKLLLHFFLFTWLVMFTQEIFSGKVQRDEQWKKLQEKKSEVKAKEQKLKLCILAVIKQ